MNYTISHTDFFDFGYEEAFPFMVYIRFFKMCKLTKEGLTPMKDIDYNEFDLIKEVLEFEFDQGYLKEIVLDFGYVSITIFADEEM